MNAEDVFDVVRDARGEIKNDKLAHFCAGILCDRKFCRIGVLDCHR